MEVTIVTPVHSTYVIDMVLRATGESQEAFVRKHRITVLEDIRYLDLNTGLAAAPPMRTHLQHAMLEVATAYGVLAAVLQVLIRKLSSHLIVLELLQDWVSFTCLRIPEVSDDLFKIRCN